ncbi:MAG: BamA/TamA family outer membrane protein [Bacteroidota bacterium]
MSLRLVLFLFTLVPVLGSTVPLAYSQGAVSDQGTASATSGEQTGAQENSDTTYVRVIDRRIVGERHRRTTDDLLAFVRTRENHGLFDITGLTPGYWVYRLGTRASLPGWLGAGLRRIGDEPAILDTAVVATDALRLAALYRQDGYRQAQVLAAVDSLGGNRVRVTFDIQPGQPSLIDTIRYAGIEALPAETQQALVEETLLDARVAEEPRTLVGMGQRFAEADLLAERGRLIEVLQRRGHPLVTRDSIRAIVFGANQDAEPDTVAIRFEIRPGPRMRFGDVHVEVDGPERAPARLDSMARGDGQVTTRIEDDTRLEPFLLHRALRFAPGDPYDVSRLRATKQRLERVGVFSFSDITPQQPAASLQGDSLALPVLPHRIRLRTRPRHSIRLEGFVLQRSYLLGTERDELGLGAGVTYRNANAFGSGESFALSTSGSVAGTFDGGFPTAQIDASATLTLPYLVRPFSGLERGLVDARTRYAARWVAARRDLLRIVIRSRVELGAQLELRHSTRTTSFLDLLDLNLSDPDTLGGFEQDYLSIIQDPVEREFLLDDYTRPQINNALRYTLRSTTANLFRRDRGYVREISVETGGNLLYLFDRFVFSPDSLEGTLPSIIDGADLEYRPYLRLRADARQYVPLSRRTTLAFKAIVGVALPTGDAPVVPFDRRFYIGGATSVRGWALRTLGPGVAEQEGAFVQGGDLKLELAAEGRTVLVRNLFKANWSAALFADAGNVWLGPRNPGDDAGRFFADQFYRQLALSAGYGLRIGWEFLVVRFDLAYRVREPQPGAPWFPDGLRRPLFHFGIGQAF